MCLFVTLACPKAWCRALKVEQAEFKVFHDLEALHKADVIIPAAKQVQAAIKWHSGYLFFITILNIDGAFVKNPLFLLEKQAIYKLSLVSVNVLTLINDSAE